MLAIAAALAVVVIAVGAVLALGGGDDDGGGGAEAEAEGPDPDATLDTASETTVPETTGSTEPPIPDGPFVHITDVRLEDGLYRVDYEVSGFTPLIGGSSDSLHVHFFPDTIERDNAGTNGDGSGVWDLTDDPSSFLVEDWGPGFPQGAVGATQMCALVADANHGVFQQFEDPTGDCVDLPPA